MTHKTRSRVRSTHPLATVALALIAVTLVVLITLPERLSAQDTADALPPLLSVPSLPAIESSAPESGASTEDARATQTLLPDAARLPFSAFLPHVPHDLGVRRADRIGYSQSGGSLIRYPDIRTLNAGWYTNWGVSSNPQRPAGIEYVQLIRIHQKLSCAIGTTADRNICPYVGNNVDNYQYEYWPNKATIEAAARANPGTLWVIGNEPDRVDWVGGNQNEMLPELYARVYHDLRTMIRAVDPTAKFAIGGIIQFTPLREAYLNIVWDTYQARYNEPMPVDYWNTHNFIGSETCTMSHSPRWGMNELTCYGMGIPPGFEWTGNAHEYRSKLTGELVKASYVGRDNLHIDRTVFAQQIRNFRKWMAEKGQADKPLYVTEYGVLYTTLCPVGAAVPRDKCIAGYNSEKGKNLGNGITSPGYVELDDAQAVADFMVWTFDFFADTVDTNLTSHDGGRLVQRWLWYSLDTPMNYGFNVHSTLYDSGTRQLTTAGRAFRDYTAANLAKLRPYNGLP